MYNFLHGLDSEKKINLSLNTLLMSSGLSGNINESPNKIGGISFNELTNNSFNDCANSKSIPPPPGLELIDIKSSQCQQSQQHQPPLQGMHALSGLDLLTPKINDNQHQQFSPIGFPRNLSSRSNNHHMQVFIILFSFTLLF